MVTYLECEFGSHGNRRNEQAVQLWKVSYVSIATAPNEVLDADVREICRIAQKHNLGAGITGILTFNTGRFAQLIEGSERELRALMLRIIADPRHHSLKVMADYPIVARQFGEWSMAYRSPKDFVRDQIDGLIKQTSPAVMTDPGRSSGR